MTGEGWHPDPFGRHELRFHDGVRWQAYVRDGDSHTMDEPGGLIAPNHAVVTPDQGAAPSAVTVLNTETIEVRQLGKGAAELFSGEERIGAVKRTGKRGVGNQEIVDAQDALLVSVVNPGQLKKRSVQVRDATLHEIGRIEKVGRAGAPQLVVGATPFATVRAVTSSVEVLGTAGTVLGEALQGRVRVPPEVLGAERQVVLAALLASDLGFA